MSEHELGFTEEEQEAILAITNTLTALAAVWDDGDESPAALRMLTATMRAGADTLDGAIERWEARQHDE